MRFGDIFAGDHLFDVFLRSDAHALGTHELGSYLRQQLATKYNRPDVVEAIGAVAYSPVIPPKRHEDYLLGHGQRCRAVLISEDCTIEDSYGRPGQSYQGRLLFAAIRDATPNDVTALQERGAFDRFPLPADERMPIPGIADLRRVFMVHARDADPMLRIASLSDEMAEDLAVNWSAYVTRHGPLPGLKNAEKLAHLLARASGDPPTDPQKELARLIAEVVNLAWRLEGEALQSVSDAFASEDSDVAQVVATVKNSLETLRDTIDDTLQSLGAAGAD